MKKGPPDIALHITFLLIITFLLTGCIREVIYTLDDRYTAFPEAEILGASFFYKRNNQEVSGDEVGMISKNEDGTYKVRMRRRVPSSDPTAMYITGSFEFSEFYKIVCTFPDDPAIADKPYRVYACASRKMDANLDADYPTASDLLGESVFRNGVAMGTFTMTNEGINYLNPDRWGRPYVTVFLYLYFNNVSDPDDYYEFTLDFVGGANGYTPESKVTKTEIFRTGDTDNKFILEASEKKVEDPVLGGTIIKTIPVLARFNHRFDSNKITPAIPVIGTSSINVNLTVPDEDAGREIVFEMRNIGLFQSTKSPAPPESNLITTDMIMAAKIAGLSGAGEADPPEFIVSEHMDTSSTPSVPFFRVKTKIVNYGDMTGVKLVISGTETFSDTSRFTFTLLVPEKYVGEE